MRVMGAVEVGGVEYQAIWASRTSIQGEGGGAGKAMAVRDGDGKTEIIIGRNAKLAVVEASLRHLRGIGLKPSHLCQLFNYRGDEKGLPQHVKVLVSSLT